MDDPCASPSLFLFRTVEHFFFGGWEERVVMRVKTTTF